MRNIKRKLDNNAKAFSVAEKKYANIFRLTVLLKEKVDENILKLAIKQVLELIPSFKVKLKSGFFWNYFGSNKKEPIVEKEQGIPCQSLNFQNNNDYLFKVTYDINKINLELFHVLTDGTGGILFLKEILYNYFNLKYNLKSHNPEKLQNIKVMEDEYLKNGNKKIVSKEKYKKAFLINKQADLYQNKTFHYILDLEKIKKVCHKQNTSITKYLTTLYILAIYKTIYDKKSLKDIVITIPIDLRKYYNSQTLANFFTCMCVESNIITNQNITFKEILKQVNSEFKNKLTVNNIPKFLARDIKLGTNVGINLMPLFMKKLIMKYFDKTVNQAATSTLSNIGVIEIDKSYEKYIDNIYVLVNAGKVQKVKCTICSFKNHLNITINSNLISDSVEKEFSNLLKNYVGDIKFQSNVI